MCSNFFPRFISNAHSNLLKFFWCFLKSLSSYYITITHVCIAYYISSSVALRTFLLQKYFLWWLVWEKMDCLFINDSLTTLLFHIMPNLIFLRQSWLKIEHREKRLILGCDACKNCKINLFLGKTNRATFLFIFYLLMYLSLFIYD